MNQDMLYDYERHGLFQNFPPEIWLILRATRLFFESCFESWNEIENIATPLKSCKIFAILIQLEYHFITRGILSKDTLLCLKIIIKLPFF